LINKQSRKRFYRSVGIFLGYWLIIVASSIDIDFLCRIFSNMQKFPCSILTAGVCSTILDQMTIVRLQILCCRWGNVAEVENWAMIWGTLIPTSSLLTIHERFLTSPLVPYNARFNLDSRSLFDSFWQGDTCQAANSLLSMKKCWGGGKLSY